MIVNTSWKELNKIPVVVTLIAVVFSDHIFLNQRNRHLL